MSAGCFDDRRAVARAVLIRGGLEANDEAETAAGARGQERSDTRKQRRASTACHVLRVTLRVPRVKTGIRNEA